MALDCNVMDTIRTFIAAATRYANGLSTRSKRCYSSIAKRTLTRSTRVERGYTSTAMDSNGTYPFTTGNPFSGTLLGCSIGRGSGALKGLTRLPRGQHSRIVIITNAKNTIRRHNEHHWQWTLDALKRIRIKLK